MYLSMRGLMLRIMEVIQMYKNCVGYYLDTYESLLPTDEALGEVAEHLWYLYIKGKFNDMVWADFYDREVFNNHKFPSSDPEGAWENMVKTIKIRMINKDRIYSRMFTAFLADYNPLWNVDGVTGRITESTHTGTDTDAHTGKDTLKDTGGHSNTKTGNQTLGYTGTEQTDYIGREATTQTGSETDTHGGNITETDSNVPYDSNSFLDTHKKVTTPTDTNTKSFTNRKEELEYTGRHDDKSFTNRVDTTTYNNVKDQFSYDSGGEQHETSFASTLTKTLNLSDQDLELIIRQGNIGVTKSSELLLDTLALYDHYLMDFVRYVVNDCINQVSYAIW